MTSTRKKRRKEQFERSCKCKDHEIIIEKYNEEPQVFTVGSKDYSRMAYNYLVNDSLLTSRCKYVCNICLKYASDSLNKENDNIDSSNKVLSDENNEKISNELEESIISSIEELLKKLERTKNLEISEKLNGKLQSLTSFIGTNYFRPAITSDTRQISSMYKYLNFLKKI